MVNVERERFLQCRCFLLDTDFRTCLGELPSVFQFVLESISASIANNLYNYIHIFQYWLNYNIYHTYYSHYVRFSLIYYNLLSNKFILGDFIEHLPSMRCFNIITGLKTVCSSVFEPSKCFLSLMFNLLLAKLWLTSLSHVTLNNKIFHAF